MSVAVILQTTLETSDDENASESDFVKYLAVPVKQTFATLLMMKMQNDYKFYLMVLIITALHCSSI